MKICLTSSGTTLNDLVDPRFGRAPYFIVVDSETMEIENIPNNAAGAMSGAGIQAAQTITNKNVNVVITGNVGPNAYRALAAANIKIVVGASGIIKDVIEKYKRGELKETNSPTVNGHFGTGGSRGMGMGKGRRMGS